MGCSLIFTRAIKSRSMSDQLKWIIEKEYGLPYVVTTSDLGFFQGLLVAGINDAEKIIEAIQKYGEITLELEC